MNSYLLNRQLGSISPQALAKAQNYRLLQSLQLAEKVHFELQKPRSGDSAGNVSSAPSIAHAAGVNSIAVDRFEGRYLLSGGADSSVAIWDLESSQLEADDTVSYLPLGHALRTSTTESLGITHISFYPFDSLAFLTSGYDRTVKLFSSETLTASANFDLGSTVYSHATSDVATHLLVACASQHPAVRLIDLRSGSSTHSLAGHAGSILSVAWHPRNEHLLASGATDGSCRLWDIRRSASSLGVLDADDSIGVAGYDGKGTGARRRERGKAHNGAVNGIAWTQSGRDLVTTGHDERMRIWNMSTGANTLANFGPSLKNSTTTVLTPLIPPSHLSPTGSDSIYFPNPGEVLSLDMHSGSVLQRLRVPNVQKQQASTGVVRNLNTRTTSLAWRAHAVEMYSAHADGTIRCWLPRLQEDVVAEQEEGVSTESEDEGHVAERKRKREELDEIVASLTKKKTTYT